MTADGAIAPVKPVSRLTDDNVVGDGLFWFGDRDLMSVFPQPFTNSLREGNIFLISFQINKLRKFHLTVQH